MNRVEIEQNTFKKMLEGVKHAVSTDDCRPLLQFITFVLTKTTVTLYAHDGFRAAKIQIAKESESEFTCFIKPLTFKPIKRGDAMAILKYDADNRTASVSLKTEYGELRYGFTQPDGEYIDIEKLYADAHVHDRELGINAAYVAQALNSICKTTSDRNNCTVFESKDCNTAPFILRAKDKDIVNEQLVLPIRILEW